MMYPKQTPRPSARETFLTLLLLTLVGGGFLIFFVGIMGLFVLHALGIVALMAGFGCFHYLLWGRALTEEVTAERDEEELPVDADGWPLDGPPASRRF